MSHWNRCRFLKDKKGLNNDAEIHRGRRMLARRSSSEHIGRCYFAVVLDLATQIDQAGYAISRTYNRHSNYELDLIRPLS